jgi:hypothetical protein
MTGLRRIWVAATVAIAASSIAVPGFTIAGALQAVDASSADVASKMLGARYDATRSHIDFTVYSSHATRIDCAPAGPFGAPAR